MSIQLAVPLVRQSHPYECWYASACMLAYYRRPGPRLGDPSVWGLNRGMIPSEFVNLAKNEGLKPVPNANRDWSLQDLEGALQLFGPLWCAGQWQGVGHIIVVTGVDEKRSSPISINDPAYATPKQGDLDWFNAKLDKFLATPMLYSPR